MQHGPPQLPATHAKAGTVLAHWTGHYTFDISRTSFGVYHCAHATSCRTTWLTTTHAGPGPAGRRRWGGRTARVRWRRPGRARRRHGRTPPPSRRPRPGHPQHRGGVPERGGALQPVGLGDPDAVEGDKSVLHRLQRDLVLQGSTAVASGMTARRA